MGDLDYLGEPCRQEFADARQIYCPSRRSASVAYKFRFILESGVHPGFLHPPPGAVIGPSFRFLEGQPGRHVAINPLALYPMFVEWLCKDPPCGIR